MVGGAFSTPLGLIRRLRQSGRKVRVCNDPCVFSRGLPYLPVRIRGRETSPEQHRVRTLSMAYEGLGDNVSHTAGP